MIKLQDFARQMGVTDRAIQKHLKKYAAELEGLYQRKGPNGTWLTDEACEILRNKMRQQPMAVADTQVYRDLEAAKKKIEKLQEEKADLATQNAALSDWKANNSIALAAAAQTKLLLDSTKAELDQVKLENAALETENKEIREKADRVDLLEAGAAEHKKQMDEAHQETEKEKARADLAEKEIADLKQQLEAAQQKNQELEARGLGDYLKSIFTKKRKG